MKKLWWLKNSPFRRIGLTTLTRFALLYQAETGKNVSEFLFWIEKYLKDL